MKKILVIMIMVLMAATSQALTKEEFEQEQKEEYLEYLLRQCKNYYNTAKILSKRTSYVQETVDRNYEWAKTYKKRYEEAKNKKYTIDFKSPSLYFYGGGYKFESIIHKNGRVEMFFGFGDKEDKKVIAEKLKEQIEELTGYSKYVEEQKTELDEIGDFIDSTKVEENDKQQAKEVRYFNMAGQEVYNPDDYPCDLIVVTTYTDGRMRTTRVIK